MKNIMNQGILILIIGVLFAVMRSFGNNTKTETKAKKSKVETNQTEIDSAVSFGYKTVWLAVKTDNKKRISEILKLKNTKECNWKVGIAESYNSSIYITPQIKDWTLVCGMSLLNGNNDKKNIIYIKKTIETLSAEFGEAQFFGSHRVVEYQSWMKAINGKIVRAYCFLGESGENLIVEGEPTNFEKEYKLINTLSKEAQNDKYFEREDLFYPDEEFVMKVAENWSINPQTLEERKDIKNELGIIGNK
jgi:hypothetical protein